MGLDLPRDKQECTWMVGPHSIHWLEIKPGISCRWSRLELQARMMNMYVHTYVCIYIYIHIQIYIYIYSTKLTWPGSNLSRSSLLWLFQLSTRTGLGNLKVMDKLIFFWLRFLCLMSLLTANLHQYHFVGRCLLYQILHCEMFPKQHFQSLGLLHVPLKHHKNKVEYHHCKPLKWCLTTAQGVFWRSFRPVHSREPMAIPAYIGSIEDCSTGPGHATWQRSSLILCDRKWFHCWLSWGW